MAEYRRFQRGPRRPRFCAFCSKDIQVNYKEPEGLRRYLGENGKIKPRRQTGLCAKHQRLLAVAVKRARHLAMLSFVGEE